MGWSWSGLLFAVLALAPTLILMRPMALVAYELLGLPAWLFWIYPAAVVAVPYTLAAAGIWRPFSDEGPRRGCPR